MDSRTEIPPCGVRPARNPDPIDLRFLTDRITAFAASNDFRNQREVEDSAFRGTFAYLAASLGDHSFRKYDTSKEKFTGVS